MLIEIKDIIETTILSGNIDNNKLRACYLQAVDFDLKPELPSILYDKIVADFEGDTLVGLYLELYTNYIKPLLIYASVLWYLKEGQGVVGNAGNLLIRGDNQDNYDTARLGDFINLQQDKVRIYKNRMKEWLSENELSETADITPSENYHGYGLIF